MGKDIDDLIKSLPPEKREVFDKAQSQVEHLKGQVKPVEQDIRPGDVPNQNAIQRSAPQEPKDFLHDGKSMPDAYDQKSASSPGQQNEVEKMISDRSQAATVETGKELNQQHQVTHTKDQENER